MRYEGTVYRPPSEAYSLIVQATVGCSHNKCTFCNMYKDKTFRIRNVEDILEDIRNARRQYRIIRKFFLADGDALIIPTQELLRILDEIRSLFPECQRITSYASPKAILLKSEDDLKLLREHGLYMIYLGIESGDDDILKSINKGVTSSQLVAAGQKAKACGLKVSCTLISGLGGKEKSIDHAKASANVLNQIDPDYLGLLTLRVNNRAINDDVKSGKLTLLSSKEIMEETYLLIENLNLTNCTFRSNHASNYIALGAVLGAEKEELLKNMKSILATDSFSNEDYSHYFEDL